MKAELHPDEAVRRGERPDPARALRGWLSLRALEIFVTAAQGHGLDSAATALGLSQSAVSQAVQSIEKSIGAKLFDRSTKPAQLTLLGSKLLKGGIDLLRQARELEQDVTLFANDRFPQIRIGIAEYVAGTIAPQLFKEVGDGAGCWSIISSATHSSIKALQERQVDILINSEPFEPTPDLDVRILLREPYVLVIPAGLPIRSGSNLQKLGEKLPLIRFSEATSIGRLTTFFLENQGISLPRSYEFDTSDAVLAMVRAKAGWAITTPMSVLKSQSRLSEFHFLPIDIGTIRTLRLTTFRGQNTALCTRIERVSAAILDRDWIPRIRRIVPWIKDRDWNDVYALRNEGA